MYKFNNIAATYNFQCSLLKQLLIIKILVIQLMYCILQTSSLVVNPITVDSFAFLFNCTPDSMTIPDELLRLGTVVVSLIRPTRV